MPIPIGYWALGATFFSACWAGYISFSKTQVSSSSLESLSSSLSSLFIVDSGQVSGRLLRVHGGRDESTSPQEDLQWGRKGLQCASWWWWCWMWKMTKNVIIDSMNMILVSHLWRQRWWAWSIWRGGTQSTLRGGGRLLANNPTMGGSPSHLKKWRNVLICIFIL